MSSERAPLLRATNTLREFDVDNGVFDGAANAQPRQTLLQQIRAALKRQPTHTARKMRLDGSQALQYAPNIVRNQKYSVLSFVPVRCASSSSSSSSFVRLCVPGSSMPTNALHSARALRSISLLFQLILFGCGAVAIRASLESWCETEMTLRKIPPVFLSSRLTTMFRYVRALNAQAFSSLT